MEVGQSPSRKPRTEQARRPRSGAPTGKSLPDGAGWVDHEHPGEGAEVPHQRVYSFKRDAFSHETLQSDQRARDKGRVGGWHGSAADDFSGRGHERRRELSSWYAGEGHHQRERGGGAPKWLAPGPRNSIAGLEVDSSLKKLRLKVRADAQASGDPGDVARRESATRATDKASRDGRDGGLGVTRDHVSVEKSSSQRDLSGFQQEGNQGSLSSWEESDVAPAPKPVVHPPGSGQRKGHDSSTSSLHDEGPDGASRKRRQRLILQATSDDEDDEGAVGGHSHGLQKGPGAGGMGGRESHTGEPAGAPGEVEEDDAPRGGGRERSLLTPAAGGRGQVGEHSSNPDGARAGRPGLPNEGSSSGGLDWGSDAGLETESPPRRLQPQQQTRGVPKAAAELWSEQLEAERRRVRMEGGRPGQGGEDGLRRGGGGGGGRVFSLNARERDPLRRPAGSFGRRSEGLGGVRGGESVRGMQREGVAGGVQERGVGKEERDEPRGRVLQDARWGRVPQPGGREVVKGEPKEGGSSSLGGGEEAVEGSRDAAGAPGGPQKEGVEEGQEEENEGERRYKDEEEAGEDEDEEEPQDEEQGDEEEVEAEKDKEEEEEDDDAEQDTEARLAAAAASAAAERQLRREEAARKRKMRAEKAERELQESAIQKILGQGPKGRKRGRGDASGSGASAGGGQHAAADAGAGSSHLEDLGAHPLAGGREGPGIVRVRFGPAGTTVLWSNPDSCPLPTAPPGDLTADQDPPFDHRGPVSSAPADTGQHGRPKAVPCVAAGCRSPSRYKHSALRLPVCSLQCYRVVEGEARARDVQSA